MKEQSDLVISNVQKNELVQCPFRIMSKYVGRCIMKGLREVVNEMLKLGIKLVEMRLGVPYFA
jgi:hypothetical protein